MPDRVRVLVVGSRVIAPVLRLHGSGSKSFVAGGGEALVVGVIAEDGFAPGYSMRNARFLPRFQSCVNTPN